MPEPTAAVYAPFHRFSGVSYGVSPRSDGQHVRRSHTDPWKECALTPRAAHTRVTPDLLSPKSTHPICCELTPLTPRRPKCPCSRRRSRLSGLAKHERISERVRGRTRTRRWAVDAARLDARHVQHGDPW